MTPTAASLMKCCAVQSCLFAATVAFCVPHSIPTGLGRYTACRCEGFGQREVSESRLQECGARDVQVPGPSEVSQVFWQAMLRTAVADAPDGITIAVSTGLSLAVVLENEMTFLKFSTLQEARPWISQPLSQAWPHGIEGLSNIYIFNMIITLYGYDYHYYCYYFYYCYCHYYLLFLLFKG